MKLSITIQRQAVGTLLPGDTLFLKQLCPVLVWSQLNVSFWKAWPVEFLLVCVFWFRPFFTHVLSTWGCKGSVYKPVVGYSIRLYNDWLQSSWQVCEQREQAAHPCWVNGALFRSYYPIPSCSTAALGTKRLVHKQTGKKSIWIFWVFHSCFNNHSYYWGYHLILH